MKQKLLSLLLALTLLCTLSLPAAAQDSSDTDWKRTEPGGRYVTRRLVFPEGQELNWAKQQDLVVCYADTGEPVALTSRYLSGCLFATVPAADANRPLSVVSGTPMQFADEMEAWGYDAPLGTDELNLRGIILGSDGNLHADQIITRAEAFTIVCRLLSLEAGADPGFADVDRDDWYYETACAVKAAGITAESTYFRPMDPVTRGEFTVMLCRAMRTIGWLGESEGARADLTAADAGTIPDWALDAYLAFNDYGIGIFSRQEAGKSAEDATLYEPLARPQLGATRGEVISFLYDALRYLTYYPNPTAVEWGFDQEMPVIDGSTSTLPYTRAVYGMLFNNYTNHPQFPEEHSKSYYSYDRLISGEADVLFISTKPTEDTLAKAKAAGVELELIPIAYDAMVFFTNGENTAENLTMEQIRDIYVDNSYDNWSQLGGPDAGLIPYCRNADSGSQAQMEEFFLRGGEIHPDIRRETTAISMASVLTDVWEAQTDEPLAYALGYSIYYYYQSSSYILLPGPDTLKLLSVDGVCPTDETIADGSYPLAGYNYAVVRSDEPEDSPARRMVEFMTSPQGQQCVRNAGFGALS